MSNAKRHQRHSDKSSRSYWLYGLHAVRAALANPKRDIRRIVMTANTQDKIKDSLDASGFSADIITLHELEKLLPPHAVHQGVAAEVMPLPERSVEEVLSNKPNPDSVILLLDQVTDPHNVGAILRSSAAFGADAVIVTRDHAPQESAVMAKASSGGIEIVPLATITNLTQGMEVLKKRGYWCVGLDGDATKTLIPAQLPKPLALVLGAEGRGLRRLTAERCDMLVKLPIRSVMESLNVSNAAAVALYALTNRG